MSVAEVGNPYENAVAEWIRGILKGEFYLDRTFEGLAVARRAATDAIAIYNYHAWRHVRLGLMTPASKHNLERRRAALSLIDSPD